MAEMRSGWTWDAMHFVCLWEILCGKLKFFSAWGTILCKKGLNFDWGSQYDFASPFEDFLSSQGTFFLVFGQVGKKSS